MVDRMMPPSPEFIAKVEKISEENKAYFREQIDMADKLFDAAQTVLEAAKGRKKHWEMLLSEQGLMDAGFSSDAQTIQAHFDRFSVAPYGPLSVLLDLAKKRM